MEQNRTRSYFIYAIGEIALVMIGILLALQVNNWNEKSNNQAISQEYIQLLHTDLQADTAMLQQLLDDSLIKRKQAQRLMQYYDGDPSAIDDPMLALLFIQSIGRTNSPNFRNNTYDDLVSTGNIKLLKDRDLVNSLMSYYSKDMSNWTDEYIHRLWREYLPIAIDLLPSSFLEEIILTEKVNPGLSNTEDLLEKLERIPTADILHAFKEHPEMGFQLKNISRTHLLHAENLRNTYAHAKMVIEIIESKLKP